MLHRSEVLRLPNGSIVARFCTALTLSPLLEAVKRVTKCVCGLDMLKFLQVQHSPTVLPRDDLNVDGASTCNAFA